MKIHPHPALDLPPDFWQRDASLRRAAEMIEHSAGRIRAVSFDFFDTLVWRMVGKPTDVFYEVGHRLHRESLLPARISPADFEVLRRHAEYKTREVQNTKTSAWEDISIHDIYGQLKMIVQDPVAGVKTEHGVESDLCLLNPIMAGFIEHVRRRGLQVLILSDIYLSADHLRGILRANHFDPAIFDAILTSCEHGRVQRHGQPFPACAENTEARTRSTAPHRRQFWIGRGWRPQGRRARLPLPAEHAGNQHHP